MFDQDLAPLLTDSELEQLTAAEFASWDETQERDVLPPGFDEMVPGPFVGVILAFTDPERLSGRDLVTLLKAQARHISRTQSGYYRTLSELALAVPGAADGLPERSNEWFEYTNMEVRAALTMTRRTADFELGLAYDFVERLPAVWMALREGSIDLRRARVLATRTGHLDSDVARKVVDAVLPLASKLTAGQLGARVDKLCIELDPREARKRLKHGLEDRRVFGEAQPDGTANLMGLNLPPHKVTEACRRINGIARGMKSAEDSRTLDQIRADVFIDLLLGQANAQAKGGGVILHTDLETLAEMAEHPGDLAGFGPVNADIARQVAATQLKTPWEFVVHDENGRVVCTGITRRRPDAKLRRHIEGVYPTCIFPGCRAPAKDCDVDHRDPWAEGGKTTFENNAPVCEPDHVGRHKAGWTYVRLPDGRHRWTSRLGHTYITSGVPP